MTPRTAIALILCLAACSHASTPPAASAPSDPAPQPTAAVAAPKPEQIEVRVLLVGLANRTKPEALERATMLASMARQGDPLSELAPTYSDRPGAAEDRGILRTRTTAPMLLGETAVDAALALPVGGISDPIETPEGYLVLERLPDPDNTPAQIAARHILILYVGSPNAVPGATHSEAEARALAERIAAEAREPGADFSALAAKYTEEPGGKERGGNLGTFGRGQMVPAFESVAFKLEVNEVSGVVQSPFGFHVIQRYE